MKKILILMAGVMLMVACSPNREKELKNIAEHEQMLSAIDSTSDNNADAWYIGVTPKLVCGVWVGGEYRQIHFRSGALGQGSRTALPICGAFFNKVFTDPALKRYHGHFPPVKEWIDPAQYQRCVQEVVPDTATWETDSLDVDSTAIVYDIENEYENETPPDTTKHAN